MVRSFPFSTLQTIIWKLFEPKSIAATLVGSLLITVLSCIGSTKRDGVDKMIRFYRVNLFYTMSLFYRYIGLDISSII